MKNLPSKICAVFALSMLLTEGATPAGAGGWEGRKLADIPVNFIVGYGTLINTPSRNATATQPIPAIPVRVAAAFGYIRSWNERRDGFTALGLRKKRPDEKAQTINGVLYPVTEADIAKFDAREHYYIKAEVPAGQIEAVGWLRLPETGHFWIYVPRATAAPSGQAPSEQQREPDPEHPLIQSYIDVVVEGGLEYGTDFAREILETTAGWSRFWLNDRELARRPWVHDPKSADVDALLSGAATTAPFFASRAFPEFYGERLRAVGAK